MNLASFLCSIGRLTFVIDADPQRSATRWAASKSGSGGIEVHFLDADRSIEIVSQDVQRLGTETGAEFAVLDCPPQLRNTTEAALLLADVTLIPVGASPLDIWAAEEVLEFARDAQAIRGDGKPQMALVPNRLNRTVMARELPGVLEALGERLAPGITERIVVAESAILGQTLLEYAPKSRASGEFLALTHFVLELLDGQSKIN
jgi:chromosome partitioning protein